MEGEERPRVLASALLENQLGPWTARPKASSHWHHDGKAGDCTITYSLTNTEKPRIGNINGRLFRAIVLLQTLRAFGTFRASDVNCIQ
jgi:hypothetical protein